VSAMPKAARRLDHVDALINKTHTEVPSLPVSLLSHYRHDQLLLPRRTELFRRCACRVADTQRRAFPAQTSTSPSPRQHQSSLTARVKTAYPPLVPVRSYIHHLRDRSRLIPEFIQMLVSPFLHVHQK
jgi:hypothetical protein